MEKKKIQYKLINITYISFFLFYFLFLIVLVSQIIVTPLINFFFNNKLFRKFNYYYY